MIHVSPKVLVLVPSNPPKSSVPDRVEPRPDWFDPEDAIPIQQRVDGNNALKRLLAFCRSRAAIPACLAVARMPPMMESTTSAVAVTAVLCRCTNLTGR